MLSGQFLSSAELLFCLRKEQGRSINQIHLDRFLEMAQEGEERGNERISEPQAEGSARWDQLLLVHKRHPMVRTFQDFFTDRSLTISSLTSDLPVFFIPICAAAAADRSITRPACKGPRSLTLTSTDLRLRMLVTRTLVPSGSDRCAAVSLFWQNLCPLAVFLPLSLLEYTVATPCIDFADLAAIEAGAALCLWLREASDGFDALTEVAALSDCPMENSIIAKPIMIIKMSLVVRIKSFSQVKSWWLFLSR